jgi:hypothetical protein
MRRYTNAHFRPKIHCHLERKYGTVRRCQNRFAFRNTEEETQVRETIVDIKYVIPNDNQPDFRALPNAY